MDIYHIIITILIGVMAGVFSGLFGIGGGVVIVPALVLILGYNQKLAQGSTLLMLMFPVVALAVLKYYQAGNVNWKVSLLLGIGFVVGGYYGGKIVNQLPESYTIGTTVIYEPLKKLFALLLIAVAVKILWGK